MIELQPHPRDRDGVRWADATFQTRLLDSVRQAVIVTDLDGTISLLNRFAESLYGWTADEAVGRNVLDVIRCETTRGQADGIMTILSTGESWTGESRVLRRDGTAFWAEVGATPIVENGLLVGIIRVSTDITERKQETAALRDSEYRFRSAFDDAETGQAIVGFDGQFLRVNASLCALVGYAADELTGMNYRDITHPDDIDIIEALDGDGRAATVLPSFSFEKRYIHKDGRQLWVQVTSSVVHDDDGQPLCRTSQILDITERKLAEERDQLLARISSTLQESLDPETTLRRLVTALVPSVADWCSVVLVEDDGSLRRVAVVHADPAKTLLASELMRLPLDHGSTFGLPAAIRSGQSIVDTHERIEAWRATLPPNYARVQQALGNTAQMHVPLIVRGRVIGGIAFIIGDSGRCYTEADLPFVEEVARRAALAIDNARLHHDLRQSEATYRRLIERIPAAIYIEPLDVATGTTLTPFISPQIEKITGYSVEHCQSTPNYFDQMVHPDDRARRLDEIRRTDVTGEPYRCEYRIIHRDGRTVWVLTEAVLVHDDDGRPLFWHGLLTDITERKQAEAALRESENRFRSAFDDAAIGMAIQSLDSTFLRVNPALCVMTGYDETELTGQRGAILSHPDDVEVALPHLDLITSGETSTFMLEKRYLHKDGHTIWVFLSAGTIRDVDGTPLHCITQVQDISTQKELQAVLIKQALHDQLTGLPSRVLLLDRTARALAQAERHDRHVAILFLDLDNFKNVNDSLGHAIGDELLIQVASRLSGCLREGDTASRLGGDEFAILLPEVANAAGAVDVAQRVLHRLSSPFLLAGRDITMTVSVGIALNGASADDLLRHADVALYRAKAKGKSQYAIFDTTMHASILQRLELEHDLRRAIDDEQFMVFYQPIVALGTGETVGMEALVRWQHPVRGVVYPADFIPIAEETGLIVPLGYWVLTEAARQTAEWNQSRPEDRQLSISVNLSPRQFRQPNLVPQVETILNDMGLDPQHLVIEITESVVMGDVEEAVEQLHALKALGVEISIDDFGTGYSSLAYLQRFPVDVLKIDRSFIVRLGAPDEATAIVTAIISMAHALKIRVVAEGIETQKQLEQLQRLGCERGQGYYFAKPLPASATLSPSHLGQVVLTEPCPNS